MLDAAQSLTPIDCVAWGPAHPPPVPRVAPLTADCSEGDLGAALSAGDPSAARVAWSRFAPMVRRILRRALGPQADVEDLTQDVFVSLFQAVHALKEPTALRGFLIVIAVRTVQAERRRRNARRFLMLGLEPELIEGVAGSADVSAAHSLRRFYRLLDHLRESDRLAYVLRFIERMSSEEVAAATGVSIATARRRFLRAAARVRYYAERDPFLSEYMKAAAAAKAQLESPSDVDAQLHSAD
jgi:RNA polymerase sigma-70 factor (ECF subfamily)